MHLQSMTNDIPKIQGQLERKRLWSPLRILLAVTGICLIIGIAKLTARFMLQLRTNATAVLSDGLLTVETIYSLWGKQFRKAKTITPRDKINSIQLENQFRVAHLIIGFGFLVVGLLCGVHWLLNGLGAGYPYLFLIGAGIILAGIVIDVILFHLIPEGEGRSSVIINTAAWRFRLTGLNKTIAEQFVTAATKQLSSPAVSGTLRTQVPNEPTPQ